MPAGLEDLRVEAAPSAPAGGEAGTAWTEGYEGLIPEGPSAHAYIIKDHAFIRLGNWLHALTPPKGDDRYQRIEIGVFQDDKELPAVLADNGILGFQLANVDPPGELGLGRNVDLIEPAHPRHPLKIYEPSPSSDTALWGVNLRKAFRADQGPFDLTAQAGDISVEIPVPDSAQKPVGRDAGPSDRPPYQLCIIESRPEWDSDYSPGQPLELRHYYLWIVSPDQLEDALENAAGDWEALTTFDDYSDLVTWRHAYKNLEYAPQENGNFEESPFWQKLRDCRADVQVRRLGAFDQYRLFAEAADGLPLDDIPPQYFLPPELWERERTLTPRLRRRLLDVIEAMGGASLNDLDEHFEDYSRETLIGALDDLMDDDEVEQPRPYYYELE